MESPFGCKVQCSKCDSTESTMWHPMEDGTSVQCSKCLEIAYLASKVVEKEEQKPPVTVEKSKTPPKKNMKSTRSYKTRQNPNAVPKQITPKGKGRRQIFKKTIPVKLQTSGSTYTTVESLFHDTIPYRLGDIVALEDEDHIYYAQINGLMVDQYGEKSASLFWLVPNRKVTDDEEFNVLDYRVYLKDDLPRSLDSMTFVMHSPLEYYLNNVHASFSQGRPDMRSAVWGRLAHLC